MTLGAIGLVMIALGIAGWMAFALRKAGLGLALIAGFAVPVAALALYAVLGSPEVPDLPLAGRKTAEPEVAHSQEQVDFRKMVAGLADRLEKQPNDEEGWTMLARSYRALGEWAAASNALSRVIALKGERTTAGDWAELSDLLIAVRQGLVDDQALDAAQRSLKLDPTVAKSRHFVALAAAQRGRYEEAIELWRALLADAPADATWREPVAEQLGQVEALLAQKKGLPLPPPPVIAAAPPAIAPPAIAPAPSGPAADIARPQSGPTAADVAAARDMSGQDRAAFIESMVQRLADRLKDQPDDPAGWLRLGRAYGVLGRADDSAAALSKAEELAKARLAGGNGDPAEMQAVLDSVRQLRGQ